ncbi:MAG: hypothetical protein COA54_02395 [Thiotrichaceae bacterium]|nr:MAG: hypothetical protein COA54_02395 [Thiotrichaceae bacterium]
MKKIVILCALLSGCVAYPDYSALQVRTQDQAQYMEPLYSTIIISPKVAPDGAKSFGASGWTKLPKDIPPSMTIEKWHANLIATELARQRICMNGYSYEKVNEIDGIVTYSGQCK